VPRAKQLLEAHEATGKSVISLIEVDKKDADKYGMAAIKEEAAGGAYQLTKLVEKPGEANAPSNLASVGGYLLTPDILPIIAEEKVDKSGEITLADSINELAQQDIVYGRIIDGVWHDTGNQLKYIKAVVDVALESEEYGEEFHDYLVDRLTDSN
jgi:UTP--glucose-1-phosphate uridylyltransferase